MSNFHVTLWPNNFFVAYILCNYFLYLQDIHTSLRKSAGLINFVKDTLIPQLIEKPVSGSDLDIRVVAAYLNQCTAEAQEGKIIP